MKNVERANRASIIPLLALAEIHRTNNDYEERRKALLEASRIKPDDVDLLHEIARIEEREGDDQRALGTLERAAKLDKTNRSRERIARLYFNTGRDEEAFRTIAEIAASDQIDPRNIESLAGSMSNSYNWDSVTEFLAPYVAQFPDDYRLSYFYALAQEENGYTDIARRTYLKLLQQEKDIPGLKAKPVQNQMASYENELRGFIPPEALDMIGFFSGVAGAYMHRNDQNSAAAAMMGQSLAGSIMLPADLKSLRHYSLAHLIQLGKLMKPEDLEALKDEIKALGLQHVDVMFELETETMSNGFPDVAAYLVDNPDDLTLNALGVLNSMNETRLTMEQLNNAFTLFEDQYPELAFACGMSAATMKSPESAELVDRAIKLGRRIENPSVFTVAYMLIGLGSNFGSDLETHVTEEQRKRLSELLILWYPTINRNSNYHEYFFYNTVGAFSKNADVTPLVKFLNREFAASSGSAPNAQLAMIMGRQATQLDISPLAFPRPICRTPRCICSRSSPTIPRTISRR